MLKFKAALVPRLGLRGLAGALPLLAALALPSLAGAAPTISVSTTTAGLGQTINVTVAGGPASVTDWVGMYSTSAADTAWLDWKFLSGTRTAPAVGRTSATIAFVMPTTAGTYNFRFFSNNTYTKLATSPTVDVAPAPVLGVSPTKLAFGTVALGGGANQTVRVTNVGVDTLTGGASIAGSTFSLVGTTTYALAAGESFDLTVRFSPTLAGLAAGTLTLTGGGGASVPLSGTGTTGPALAVNTTNGGPGQTITVTVTGGPGNPKDWVAMHATSAGDTAWLDWKYLSGTRTAPATGVTTAALSFVLPSTGGTYNFRFFQNGLYTKLATSATVTVTVPPALGVSPSSVAWDTVTTGFGVNRTVTVSNTGGGTLAGTATTSGSSSFSLVGAASYSLGAGQSKALTVRFLPTGTGSVTGTLTLTGGAGATVALGGTGVAGPALSVSATSAGPGQTLTVDVTGGPGNILDWVGLHQEASADNVYLDWKYLTNSRTAPATGLTSATLTFTLPTTGASYNFRFFSSGGFTRLATSDNVGVILPPTLGVSPASVAWGPVALNAGVDRPVTVKNIGGGLLQGTGAVSGAGFSIAGNAAYSLSSGQASVLTLRFTPTVVGAASGTLTLTGGAGATVALSGSGVAGAALSVAPPSVGPGQTATLTVSGGPGNARDWVGLYPTAAADTGQVDWKYLNGTRTAPTTGVTTTTLTFTMPTSGGSYNFRFFANDTFSKLATSTTVTVVVPPLLEVTPASLAFDTVSVNGTVERAVIVRNSGGGTLSGGVSISGAGFSLAGTTTYSLGAGQTATLTVRFRPTAAGVASGTLTLTGAAGASVPLSGTGIAGPALSTSSVLVGPGQVVTVNVTGGPGQTLDWVSLTATDAPDDAWLDWKYLSNTQTAPATGLTTAVLTFTMPVTPGTFDFRFFQNGVYNKLTSSTIVTVVVPPTLSVTPTALPFGTVSTNWDVERVVTVKNTGGGTLTGVGTVSGSPAFSLVGPSAYSLATGQSTTLTVRFLPTSVAGSTGTLTLTGGAGATVALTGNGVAGPALSVSTTTASPGQVITVTVTSGPGNASDWVGLHTAAAVDVAWLDWKYLNGTRTAPASGLSGAQLTFTLPATPGTYSFRLFANNTFNRLATSATVTAQ